MHNQSRTWQIILLGALSLMLNSCGDGEKAHRGIELMPDMFVHPGYKRQNGIEVHADRSSDGKEQQWPVLMPPVPGTVSRNGPTYQLNPGDFVSARKLVNPLTPTSAVLRQGLYSYNVYCVVCHGRDGNSANGYVAKYFTNIPSLATTQVAAMPDGEIFHIISVGRARMPNYVAQLRADQRWAVIDYVRVLTRSSLAVTDLARLVKVDEAAVTAKPDDANAKLILDRDRTSLEQRTRDLADIQRVGDDAGAGFKPLPDPRPEYVVPSWPSADGQPAGQEQAK